MTSDLEITGERLTSLFRPRSVTLVGGIARIGELALALGDELASVEVNPLRVDGSVIEALDAVVTWKDS